MVQLGLKDSNWIKLDTWECDKTEWTNTLFALNHYQEKYAKLYEDEVKLMLLCGADLLESFSVPNLWLEDHVLFFILLIIKLFH